MLQRYDIFLKEKETMFKIITFEYCTLRFFAVPLPSKNCEDACTRQNESTLSFALA